MLHLYQSNRLEDIYAMISAVFRLQPLSNPLAKETVVVQSKGMGRWLNFHLAKEHGIAANIEYPLPASFFWTMLNQMLGEQKRRSVYSPEVLTFRILKWLEYPSHLVSVPVVAQYLQQGGDFRRYELAARLADSFDQYLIYRPDWLRAWESGENAVSNYQGEWLKESDAIWQARLWRELVEESQQHRAHTLVRLQELIDRGEGVERLPERISLVGISTLPPVYMDLLKRLAVHRDVFFFALNPCAEVWGDILDASSQELLAGQDDPAELYLDVGNPLLASWGKQGRDFFDSLSQEAELHSVFDLSEEPVSLLAHLQRDILTLTNRDASDRLKMKSSDRSVQIHCCHSEMREIEVLHDQLLSIFSRHPELQPSDVVVLTPDIQRYDPYIEAVFAPHEGTPSIPYAIADISTVHRSPLAQAFLSLLGLSQSRFLADEVLKWLELPVIARKFGLTEDDIPLLHRWVSQTHIRWARDGDHKASLGLPHSEQNSWREGLSRMMLGITLPVDAIEQGMPLYHDYLPYDDIEGSSAWIAARLSLFVETLFRYAELFSHTYSLEEWAVHTLSLVEDFFMVESPEDIQVGREIRELIQSLNEIAQEAGHQTAIDESVIRAWFSQQLESKQSGGGFLTGGVTFCTMVPMRSLPFKVICILGMTDEAFPRRRRASGFDLMARYLRKGDRSRRADDRFLFLETLLSARQLFYISYVGRHIQTDQVLPPSILVSDLQHVIAKGFELEQSIFYLHALQPFDPRYFSDDPRFVGYAEGWRRAATWVGRGFLSAQSGHHESLTLSDDPAESISVAEILEAVVNPTRYLLQRKCGFGEPRFRPELETAEPFEVGYSARDQLRAETYQRIADSQGALRDMNGLKKWARATGMLPHGAWGERLYRKEAGLMQRLYRQASLYRQDAVLLARSWHIRTDEGLTIQGWLQDLRPSGRVVVLRRKLTPYYLMEAWLDHLALCYLNPDEVLQKRTLLIAEGGIHQFLPCHAEEALVYWQDVFSVYKAALQAPLPLFRKTSSTFASEVVRGLRGQKKSPDEVEFDALEKAATAWKGGFGATLGEWESDAWLSRIWAGIDPTGEPWKAEFMRLAMQVWQPLYQHLEEFQ